MTATLAPQRSFVAPRSFGDYPSAAPQRAAAQRPSAQRSSAQRPGEILRPVRAAYPALVAGRTAGPVIRINSGARYTAVLPIRLAAPRPTTQIYVRRRLLVVLVLVAVVVALWAGAGTVLANRGGDPASTPTVSPAATYVVRAGDTLWSIAQQFHGHTSQAAYVDTLVAVNGGTSLQVGQQITLP